MTEQSGVGSIASMSESQVILTVLFVVFIVVLPLVFGSPRVGLKKPSFPDLRKIRDSYRDHVASEVALLKKSERQWRGQEWIGECVPYLDV